MLTVKFEIETVPNKDFSLESESLVVCIRLVEDLESSDGEWKYDITPKGLLNGSKSYSLHLFS